MNSWIFSIITPIFSVTDPYWFFYLFKKHILQYFIVFDVTLLNESLQQVRWVFAVSLSRRYLMIPWLKLRGLLLKQTVSLNILWPVNTPCIFLPQSALIYTYSVAIRLTEALEFTIQFKHEWCNNLHADLNVTSILAFHLWGFHRCRPTMWYFFCSYATVFSPDPTLSRENRISNFKTSFHCNVSECRITSEQRISLVSLETHIKLIISYFTSAKQCSVFSRTLANITFSHYVLGERDTAP